MTEREPLRQHGADLIYLRVLRERGHNATAASPFPFPCFVQQPESLLERTLCAGDTTP